MISQEQTDKEGLIDDLLIDRMKALQKYKARFSTKTDCFLTQNKIELQKIMIPGLFAFLFGSNNEKPTTTYEHLIDIMRLLQMRGAHDPEFVKTMAEAIRKIVPLSEKEKVK